MSACCKYNAMTIFLHLLRFFRENFGIILISLIENQVCRVVDIKQSLYKYNGILKLQLLSSRIDESNIDICPRNCISEGNYRNQLSWARNYERGSSHFKGALIEQIRVWHWHLQYQNSNPDRDSNEILKLLNYEDKRTQVNCEEKHWKMKVLNIV